MFTLQSVEIRGHISSRILLALKLMRSLICGFYSRLLNYHTIQYYYLMDKLAIRF